jgi:adenylate cyclase
MRPSLRSALLPPIAASLLVFLVVFGLREAGVLEPLGLAAYDWNIRLRRPETRPGPPVVLVTVTEQDIQELKTWPLPDAVLARALQTLVDDGALAVGVDIYRDIPVPPGHEELNAVLRKNHQIIATMKFSSGGGSGVAPPPVLEGSDQVGFTDVPVDSDGTVRRGLLFVDDGKNTYYSLALRVALLYLGAHQVPISGDPENPSYIRFGHTTIRPFAPNDGSYVRADAGGYQFLLDYREPPGAFPAITLSQLLSGEFDPAILKGKIALIGVTAASVKDSFRTPYNRGFGDSPSMYGIALHAHIASQLLRAGLRGDAPIGVIGDGAEDLWILMWCVLGAALAYRLRSVWRFSLAVAGGLALLALGVHGLFLLGWWIPLVSPALGWVGAAGLTLAYVSSREKKERSSLMSLFSSYTSAQLAETIWNEREQFLSGGRPRPQKLTATAFFTDVASFTTVSEKLDPQALMDWLSEFMEVVTPLVSERGGVILRFIGDSIMAVFGVPVARTSEQEVAQDAVNAVDCALAIERRVVELNRSLEQRGLPLVGMRIGILTGPMVAGSLGSAKRLEYNVHGDTVNTASRLESFDKEGFAPDYFRTPCRILVGESTLRRLGDQFHTELVGEARLKGKAETTRIHRVYGRKVQPEAEREKAAAQPIESALPVER